jgi:hypothetical protein
MAKLSTENSHALGTQMKEKRFLEQIVAKNDIVMSITPATKSTAAASITGDRMVAIELKNAAGERLTNINGSWTTTLSIADTAAGTASIASTTLTVVKGLANVAITRTGTWSASNTNTLTVANLTIMGITVTGGTSVETAT